MRLLVCLLMLVLTPVSARAIGIEVQGLFGSAAVLVIDGRREMLKVGQQSDSGVLLVSADSEKAVIKYGEEKKTVYLSQSITSNFQSPDEAKVIINMNQNRQYLTQGSINGRSVRFLVDTGANVISMGSEQAAALGVSLEGGQRSVATTAGGRVEVTRVTLQTVQVGAIKQHNVVAIVSHSQHPPYVLLGMTFLQHVDIRENAGLMVLTSKL